MLIMLLEFYMFMTQYENGNEELKGLISESFLPGSTEIKKYYKNSNLYKEYDI